jgi:tRNA-(ms[2]io[6]A)-hydroxylase
MVSEAGHYRLFLDLACNIGGKDKVMARWQEWLDFEAELMKEIELRGDRMH